MEAALSALAARLSEVNANISACDTGIAKANDARQAAEVEVTRHHELRQIYERQRAELEEAIDTLTVLKQPPTPDPSGPEAPAAPKPSRRKS